MKNVTGALTWTKRQLRKAGQLTRNHIGSFIIAIAFPLIHMAFHLCPFLIWDQTFDYIVAFSVFTNTTETDMLQLVSQLEEILAPNGTLAFTFLDPYYVSSPGQTNFEWRLKLERERNHISTAQMEDLARRTQCAKWFMLVNGGDLYLETEDIRPYDPEQEQTCYVYHTEEYMKNLFPQATILPPVNNEMHHCCIIRKS